MRLRRRLRGARPIARRRTLSAWRSQKASITARLRTTMAVAKNSVMGTSPITRHQPRATSANWAYMVMAALAWSLKAWCALVLPVSGRWRALHEEQRRRLLVMELRTFRRAFIDIPCQIVTGGRRVRWRILAWNPWLGVFFRLLDAL